MFLFLFKHLLPLLPVRFFILIFLCLGAPFAFHFVLIFSHLCFCNLCFCNLCFCNQRQKSKAKVKGKRTRIKTNAKEAKRNANKNKNSSQKQRSVLSRQDHCLAQAKLHFVLRVIRIKKMQK
jgi:hypothetical protein